MRADANRQRHLAELRKGETPETKLCTVCEQVHPLSAFWKTRNKEARKGRHTRCKVCAKKRQKEDYESKGRNKRLEKLYGITLEQYDAMFEAQGRVCAICGVEDPRRNGRFIVDHCHKTGRVRGLLCHPCNAMLGMADDNKDTLVSALKYLEEN